MLVGKETADQTSPLPRLPASLGQSLRGVAGGGGVGWGACLVHLAPSPWFPLELWSESGDCSPSNCLLNSPASLCFLAGFLSLSLPPLPLSSPPYPLSLSLLRSSLMALVSSRCSINVDFACGWGLPACRVLLRVDGSRPQGSPTRSCGIEQSPCHFNPL